MKNIAGNAVDVDYNVVLSAVFTNPEIATVGLSEKAAKDKKIEIEVGKFPIAANGKSLTLGKDKGFVKIIKDKSTNKIIGGAIIGAHATDLIGEIALAIKNDLTTEAIIETIKCPPNIY